MTLSRLIAPKSIVFVGGNECEIAIRRTHELGFNGAMHAVHPRREHLSGVLTKPTVDHLPDNIDAAFIAVKREPTIDIVRALRAKGCGGAVIYAAGFAEAGDVALQDELLAAANGMPLMGPNCYGFVNGLARAALWPDEHGIKPLTRGIAIITQSGNIACNLTFTKRALPLAAVFTIGNQADVDMADMVEELAGDDRITAIGLHIEGLADIAAFARACERARTLRKPIVVLKTGRSEQGAKVALSHTSSLAGADTLYDALFERLGVSRMISITAFCETLKFLHFGVPNGGRIVSLSCSGGEAALAADLAVGRRISFPPFDRITKPKVAASLNAFVTIDNPLDYHTFIWNQEEKLTATFTAVLSGGFDVGMLILDTPTQDHMNPDAWYKTARAFHLSALLNSARAAVVATLPECMPMPLADDLSASGIAPMFGLDDALTAFDAAARIRENWSRVEDLPRLLKPASSPGDIATLTEVEAKQLLRGRGLAVPVGEECASADAAAAATRIGFPVTLKVSAAHIAHKTEAGGVKLNLHTAEEVSRAAADMAHLGNRVLVERMVAGAVAELIIGVKRDPQFGLALVIGAGGVLTELLKDSAALLLPTSRQEIVRALKGLKVWPLIEGFRGKSGDQDAAVAAIETVASFAQSYSASLEELDVNPLLILPDGAIAVDALIRMRPPA
jgi:acetate---CoA ligase (ADP-forming)